RRRRGGGASTRRRTVTTHCVFERLTVLAVEVCDDPFDQDHRRRLLFGRGRRRHRNGSATATVAGLVTLVARQEEPGCDEPGDTEDAEQDSDDRDDADDHRGVRLLGLFELVPARCGKGVRRRKWLVVRDGLLLKILFLRLPRPLLVWVARRIRHGRPITR